MASITSRRPRHVWEELECSSLPGPGCPRPPNVRVSPGGVPPNSATGADVTADAACSGAPVIVDRHLAYKEAAVHANPDAGPVARIAALSTRTMVTTSAATSYSTR